MTDAECRSKNTKDDDSVRKYFKIEKENILKKFYQEELMKHGSNYTRKDTKLALLKRLCILLSKTESEFDQEDKKDESDADSDSDDGIEEDTDDI